MFPFRRGFNIPLGHCPIRWSTFLTCRYRFLTIKWFLSFISHPSNFGSKNSATAAKKGRWKPMSGNLFSHYNRWLVSQVRVHALGYVVFNKKNQLFFAPMNTCSLSHTKYNCFPFSPFFFLFSRSISSLSVILTKQCLIILILTFKLGIQISFHQIKRNS